MSSSGSGSASATRKPVNMRNWAVKRIMQEAAEQGDPDTDDFVAGPLDADIFEWHCTVRGVAGTEYEGGLYHLRILLPSSYPMSAPDIILLTPNGRFELNKKICIDGLTSFHAGSWQPAWGVRTAITGLRSFWNQDGEALSAIGALDYPKEERKRLARLSGDWVCATCGVSNAELLPDPVAGKGKGKEGDEGVKEKDEKEGVKEDKVVEDGVKDEDEDKGTVEAGPLPPGGSAPLPAAAAAVTAAAVATQAPSSGPPPPTPAARPVPPSISPPTASAAAPAAVPAPTPAPRTPVTAVPPTTAAAVPGPTPAPALAPTRTTLAPAVAAAHPHVPARFTARAAPAQTRGSPLWLDVLIGALVMLLVAMLVRH